MTGKIIDFQKEKERLQKEKKLKYSSGNTELDELFGLLEQKAKQNQNFALREWTYNDNAIGWTSDNNEKFIILMVEGLVGLKMSLDDAEKLGRALYECSTKLK